MRSMTTIVMVGTFVTLILAAPALGEEGMAPSIQAATLGWTLSNAKVVDAGKTVTTPQGTLTTGYVVEATATAVPGPAPIRRGAFRITASAFSPAADMPGQKAGMWYVRGNWKLSDERAAAIPVEARHSSLVIVGRASGVLTFNPAVTQGAMDVSIDIPRSLASGRWTEGRGNFYGNEKWEGTILLDAILWPDVAGRMGVTR